MATPREHIEEIRRTKFSIGKELNPLTEDLHQAVKIFSAELYAKDVHFLMELIQNAEDNAYPEGVKPSLEFVVTSRDITRTGASSTLLVFNSEIGFSPKNIDSICSVGRSTKKGNRKRGYIGEKGIGFKSVFLITSQPHIFSNGYQIRFNEEPCRHCNVGYIVPEWVEDYPTLSDIKKIYGSGGTLPTTTMVLPLKHDKVEPVKRQLSCIHPEVLLFLTKIKQLSVKEDNEDPKLRTLSAVAISSETNFVMRRNIDAESYTLHLSADKNVDEYENECTYYMWRQKFPVKQENVVERRIEVEEWLITLAFPYGERLRGGTNSPGVYAYLPTEMITNFPFIIQADFLLASSRETFLFHDKWNQGILDCIPSAFMSAFRSLVIETGDAPVSNLPLIFQFLPIKSSAYQQLNAVRDSIKSMLLEENIIPCESYSDQRFFNKPGEVGRLLPSFWNILKQARKQGLTLHNISSHGKYILNSSFDSKKFDFILDYLGVQPVDNEWYARCIRNSNLVMGVSEDVYLMLLAFIAENWRSRFFNTSIKFLPLVKYVDLNSDVALCSVREVADGKKKVFLANQVDHISWLIDWNREFKCIGGWYSVPKATQEAIWSCFQRDTIQKWLIDQINIAAYKVDEYASLFSSIFCSTTAITYAHFLYHSFSKNYLSGYEVGKLCSKMLLVDNDGNARTRRNAVLVPANGSKWAELIGSNPWREGYLELGEGYLHSGRFAGLFTFEKELIQFLKEHVGASDIPDLSPPDAVIATLSAPLTKRNALLLLDWISNMRYKKFHMPDRFIRCIKEGSWLKVSLSGSSCYKPPSQSFLVTSSSSWGDLLQSGSVLVDIPLIDQKFYDFKLLDYKEELKTIGVKFEFGEACHYIGERLMSLATSSNLTKSNVFAVLNFIKFLRSKMLPVDYFVNSIRKGKWLWTCSGYKSPVDSVLFDPDWTAASLVSDIPFIDVDYYGKEILSFQCELKLVGVVVGFNQNYKLVIDNLKSSATINPSTANAMLLLLACIHHLGLSNNIVERLKDKKCLKTNVGYKCPGECFLANLEWSCLLKVFDGFALIDHCFYGNELEFYKNELKRIGVVVDFELACQKFASYFQQQASYSAIRKEHVLAFLACYRKLLEMPCELPKDLKKCIREVQWLRTRLGVFRCPKDCILFGPEWESIAPISLLPFIDDSEKYYGQDIHDYKNELKRIGVITELKHGVEFVASTLRLPDSLAPRNVLSLLECIRMLQLKWKDTIPKEFLDRVSKNWVKTNFGHLPPNRSLLFDEKWKEYLQMTDGPFIDREFYGSSIALYRKELQAMGVTVDVPNGCPLLASYLHFHSEFRTIVRIYRYLSKFNWNPDGEARRKIWIPETSDSGKWVSPENCILHDKDGLFGLQLNVLDRHYERDVLTFFSYAMGVRSNPALDDYCKLWKDWENSGIQLSPVNCCAFWVQVVRNWTLDNAKTQKALANKVTKLPTGSVSGEIWLGNKQDVFIADDLLLKDLFVESSHLPLFVWYPRPSSPSISRSNLLDIYTRIGVRTISEAVHVEELSIADGVELKHVNAALNLLKKDLFVTILGFLAGPQVKMEADRRHEVVKRLLNVTVFETLEPISVNYSLSLSSGEVISVNACQMIRWEKENSKLYVQKIDKSRHKNNIEFATHFSRVISEGLLWDEEDYICDLSELIKMAFLLEFDEEAVGFLMKNKNLQIYEEDEVFLSSNFHSNQGFSCEPAFF